MEYFLFYAWGYLTTFIFGVIMLYIASREYYVEKHGTSTLSHIMTVLWSSALLSLFWFFTVFFIAQPNVIKEGLNEIDTG